MAGPFASLNGARIISGRVTIPYYGTWVADVVLAVGDTIPTQSTLTIGDLTLTGAVFRMASFTASRSARLIGGYGGWRKTIPAQFYQNPSGIFLSTVLNDAANAVGEKVKVAQDAVIGTSFTFESAPAERRLRLLAGPTWWVDPNGVTQIGPRTSAAVTTAFQVIQWSGAKGSFEIATENLSDWLPAKTFTSPTVTMSQTVGLTTIDITNEGKLRLTVLNTGAGSQ